MRNEQQGGEEKALPGDNTVEAAVGRINRTRTEEREGPFSTLGKMGYILSEFSGKKKTFYN